MMTEEIGSQRAVVLVVEDEKILRRVATRVLDRLGYDTVETPDGFTALEELRRAPQRFCLVLLDITMPGIDGVETLRRLRQTHPEIPVLIASGDLPDLLEERLRSLSYQGFAQKPYNSERLNAAIQAAL